MNTDKMRKNKQYNRAYSREYTYSNGREKAVKIALAAGAISAGALLTAKYNRTMNDGLGFAGTVLGIATGATIYKAGKMAYRKSKDSELERDGRRLMLYRNKYGS